MKSQSLPPVKPDTPTRKFHNIYKDTPCKVSPITRAAEILKDVQIQVDPLDTSDAVAVRQYDTMAKSYKVRIEEKNRRRLSDEQSAFDGEQVCSDLLPLSKDTDMIDTLIKFEEFLVGAPLTKAKKIQKAHEFIDLKGIFPGSTHIMHFGGSVIQTPHIHPGHRVVKLWSAYPWFLTLGNTISAETDIQNLDKTQDVVRIQIPAGHVHLVLPPKKIHSFCGENVGVITFHCNDIVESIEKTGWAAAASDPQAMEKLTTLLPFEKYFFQNLCLKEGQEYLDLDDVEKLQAPPDLEIKHATTAQPQSSSTSKERSTRIKSLL